MARFLMEIRHTPDEHLHTLDELRAHDPDLLSRTYWGNMAGDLSGWLLVEAESDREARDMLPVSLRDRTRIAEVSTISPEQVHLMHHHVQAA